MCFFCCSPHVVLITDLPRLTNLPVAAKWRSLGLELGVPLDQLNTIQSNCVHYSDHTSRCLTDMFDWWLKSDCESTYESLATALDAIGKRDLASKVCQENSK